ncbi:hypothetical protein BpHYR1_052629 [Brachionus plicatilis]|uniref:Uncharacterized protein n=1 Tax=Brachionus plicatilis TaxID=10195 RepID=A0A3M7R5L2_BRAPC|nr:hypothetical protein BpHYR1_052629 [Brachionus plicatilis]
MNLLDKIHPHQNIRTDQLSQSTHSSLFKISDNNQIILSRQTRTFCCVFLEKPQIGDQHSMWPNFLA